jgi:RNA polymerase sigma factor (TIGR02999 family)
MRHILSNYARDQQRLRRGGLQPDIPLNALRLDALAAPVTLTQQQAERFAHLDEALVRLEAVSPRQRRVVECRFYGGMTVSETATALDISPATVKRDWTTAKAWLYREMKRLQA